MWLSLLACTDVPTVVVDPTTLEPLEPTNQTPALSDDEAGVILRSGFDDAADHHWTHARAWVDADVASTWAALTELDVMADRRAVDAWSLTERDHREGFDHSFAIDNRVQDLVAIQFELTWLHLQLEGDTTPTRVLARWDKTDGTPFIGVLSGSVELFERDGRTELSCISHLRATGRDASGMEQYWQDLHADLAAQVDGRELPSYGP